MAKLTKAAIAMLETAGCTEVADDYLILFNSDVTVLLSSKAVGDLNRQAADRPASQDVGTLPASPSPAEDKT
jgi:hypothetical protein